MWLSSGRRAPAIWRQAGEAYVAATVAPRDHHRRAVSRGKHVRGAAGFAASGTTTISCTPGNAVADGITATITNGSAVTISCTPGNATADGVAATIISTTVISCTPGNAVADGVTATVANGSDAPSKVGGDDVPRIEIYERRKKPKKKDEELHNVVQAAFDKAMGREKAVQVIQPFDEDEDDIEALMLVL